jgi:hypothetical protein
MTKLTLNKTAIAQLGDNTKVRVRVAAGGMVQLRPTARVSGKRLPKGETLVGVKRMGIFSQIDLGGDANLAALVPFSSILVPVNHGWLSLVNADADGVKSTVKGG